MSMYATHVPCVLMYGIHVLDITGHDWKVTDNCSIAMSHAIVLRVDRVVGDVRGVRS